MNLPWLESAAWHAGILLCLCVTLRLFLTQIASRYRALTAFLLVSAMRSMLLASMPFGSDKYAEAYFITAPILYACHGWLVIEVYGQVFESYRGIAALGRWTMLGVLALGVGVAVATTLLDHDLSREPFPIIGLVFSLESIVLKMLLVFLLLICTVLVWFPIPQRPNVLLIGFGVTALTIAVTASWVVRGLNPSAWTRIASSSSLYVFAGCMGMWLFTLKPKHLDEVAARPAPATEAHEARLAGQLQSVNRALESLRKPG
jgi:hypothetical protein